MDEILARGWENFIARTSGPLNLRFLIQPIVAIFLAIKAGLNDYHQNSPAFFWSFLSEPGQRRTLAKAGFKDVGKVFIVSIILDFIYQVIVHRGVYVLELFFTAATLAIFPYICVRGPTNRIARWMTRRKAP